MRVDITGAFAKICRNLTLDHLAIDSVALMIYIFNNPGTTCDSDLFPNRRRGAECAKFLGFAPYCILDILLEDRIELVRVRDPLAL